MEITAIHPALWPRYSQQPMYLVRKRVPGQIEIESRPQQFLDSFNRHRYPVILSIGNSPGHRDSCDARNETRHGGTGVRDDEGQIGVLVNSAGEEQVEDGAGRVEQEFEPGRWEV